MSVVFDIVSDEAATVAYEDVGGTLDDDSIGVRSSAHDCRDALPDRNIKEALGRREPALLVSLRTSKELRQMRLVARMAGEAELDDANM